MKNRIVIIILFIVVLSADVFGQDVDSIRQEVRLENFLENMAETYYLEDELNYLRNNPINIFSADKEDLLKLPLISEDLAEKIMIFRDTAKSITRRGLKKLINDKNIFELIEPFISFEPVIKDFNLAYLSSSSYEMQNRRGFDTLFAGNKQKFLSKLFLRYNPYNISSGITIEKDPGENNYGDHYSGYIKYETDQSKIILGDFRVAFSEGLTIGNQSLYFMVDDISAIAPGSKSGARAYNGTDENNYFRGICGEFNILGVNSVFFYSNKNKDANIDEEGVVTSLYTSGLHRYNNENNKKDALNEKTFGGRFIYSLNLHEFSLNYYNSDYDHNYFGTGYYGLRGNSFNAVGIGYNYSSEILRLSAEASRTKDNVFAGIAYIKLFLSENHLLYLNLRKYPYDYTNPFANSISNSGNTQNEEGFLAGIKIAPLQNLEIDSYVDVYRLPYRTYYNPLPSKGMEVMVKAQYRINKDLYVSFRHRIKNSDECITIDDPRYDEIKAITEKTKKDYRLELNSVLFNNLFLKTRIDYCLLYYKTYLDGEDGFIIFQDCFWKPSEKLSLNTRIIFFNTDSYETALYEHEREVTGIYSVNALSEKGFRFYFVLNYSLENYLNMMFKYSNTTFSNKNSIGSSYDELRGRSLSKISFELGIKI